MTFIIRLKNKPILVKIAKESSLREIHYLRHDCNGFNKEIPKSTPILFQTEQEILDYIDNYKIYIASCYDNAIKIDK